MARDEQQWAEWMRLSLAGDKQAYQRFLSGVTPHLRALTRRRIASFAGPSSDIEDVVQEVLLAIHLKRHTWDATRPLGPWLSAIVRNKLIDAFRRRGRHVNVPIEDVMDTLEADEAADETVSRMDAEHMLARLKDPQRDIVRSISLNGAGIRETAQRLMMSEGAVRVSLHRALKTLAALYRSEAHENR